MNAEFVSVFDEKKCQAGRVEIDGMDIFKYSLRTSPKDCAA